jgi:hypothetical protein
VPAEPRLAPSQVSPQAAPRHRDAGIGNRARGALAAAALIAGVTASATISAWLVGRGVVAAAGDRQAPWILGRAAGVTSYLLLVVLVAMGLVLSHPWRTRIKRPSAATRIRVHVSLAVFTLAFLVLHVVVLATDSYAGVGLRGALLPMGATYRPMPVTLGVVGAWSGLLAGFTAAFAGRVTARVWWPIHKVAAVSLVLVWAHGVLAGSDTHLLLSVYLVTGAAVAALALSRYAARTPGDRVEELVASRRPGAGR